jgi:sterol desaturase/sphingolipid hydroxylase (fatty acid hydroxylase superfamily)
MQNVGDRARGQRDLTVIAVPFYFITMAAEHLWLRRRAAARGGSAGDYERRDTIASLSMGVGSLVVPLIMPKLLRPFTLGPGRWGKAVVGVAAGAAVVTTGADLVRRRLAVSSVIENGQPPATTSASTDRGTTISKTGEEHHPTAADRRQQAVSDVAGRAASIGGVTTVVMGGVALATVWAAHTEPERLWKRRVLPSVGSGPLALAVAVAAWDFIYYWNHRFMHQSRYMWAVHVVHHSSEHYNLSTALRQPVADAFGTSVPYGALCLFGIPPGLIKTARDINLLYQYWIHTETIGPLGRSEVVLNTPSHHRVHHGSNQQYLDRNHGSILILWDRLFGTFEPEVDPVIYGLTNNIETFNLGRIGTHEYVEMLRDVAAARGWAERLSYVVRGPGWAKQHRATLPGLDDGRDAVLPTRDPLASKARPSTTAASLPV